MEPECGLQTQGVRLHTPRLVGSLLSRGHLWPNGGQELILGSPEEEFCVESAPMLRWGCPNQGLLGENYTHHFWNDNSLGLLWLH